MSEYKLFAQRIGLVGIVSLLLSLSGIILLPILTKNLPIEEYGMWVQTMVTIGLIALVSGLGLPFTMIRFLAAEKSKEKIQECFYSIIILILFISLIISFLLVIFSKPFATTFLDNRIDLVLLISLIIPVECLSGVCLSFFGAFQETKKHSLFSLLSIYGMVAMVAYTVLSGYGIFWVIVSYLTAKAIVLLLMLCLIISKIGIIVPKFIYIKEYLSFGLPTIPGGISSWIVAVSDRYLIGYLLGVTYIGYYAPGYGIGEIISMFMVPFSYLLPAALSKQYDKGSTNVKTYLKYTLKYFMMLAIPSVFGLTLLSKSLLVILSTQEIASQGYLIVPFAALSTVMYGTYKIISNILSLVKKTKIHGVIWFIAAIVNLCLNFIFIPYFGILGAAITTLIAYSLALILTMYYSFKYFTFDFDLCFILKSIFASVIMSLFIIRWNPAGTLEVLTVIGVSAIVYAAILFLLKGFTRSELKFFRELFNI